MEKEKKYNFGEKTKEYDVKQGTELDVWQSPKYLESKKKAIEIIECDKYNLSTADFWILMNKTKTNKMAYTGLIISHNGCLKINDALDNKVDPSKFMIDKDGYNKSLVISYVDDEVCEFGEVSVNNCKNDYPYAMAFKRCFDRVVLKKSKLAYAGIYSDSEADEYREIPNEEKIQNDTKDFDLGEPVLTKLTEKARFQKIDEIWKYETKGVDLNKVKETYQVADIQLMTDEQLNDCLTKLKKKYGEL